MWHSEMTSLPLQPHIEDSKADDGPRPKGGIFSHPKRSLSNVWRKTYFMEMTKCIDKTAR